MDTLLHEAVTTGGSVELIQSILASGADLNAKNQKCETPLHLAVSNNKVAIAKLLLEHGASVDCENACRQTPLHRVRWATDEAVRIVDLLLSNGADVNAEDRARETPLYLAVAHDNLAVVRTLIERGASVDCKTQLGLTPLHRALLRKNVVADIIDLLLANGADANSENFKSETPLQLTVSRGDVAIVRKLLERGASVDCLDQHRRTPLHLAMNAEASAELVDLLLSSGADPNAQNSEGQTLLHLAADRGQVTIVRSLLQYGASVDCKQVTQSLTRGADVNARDFVGETPLHKAVATKSLKIAQLLIEHGASVNCKNNDRQTPLHRAAIDGPAEMVELLLASGADVNAKDYVGKTPLHEAVAKNNLPVVRLLVARGASVNSKDNSRQTPLHRALTMEARVEIVELLVASRADVNARDREGNRPLQCIFERQTRYDDCKRLSTLLSRGALVNARNNRGESALYLALKEGNSSLIDLLLKHGADVQDLKVRDQLIHRHTSGRLHILFPWSYLKAKKFANFPFGKSENYATSSDDFCDKYYLKEIEELKTTFIRNRKSLYDFLHMRVSRKAAYASSEELQQLVEWSNLKKQFPRHADIILASYREAATRKSLSKAAEEALYAITQIRLPDVVEHILDFLDDGDLISVIDANDQGGADDEEKDEL